MTYTVTSTIEVKAGDTEPVEFSVSATGLSDLTAVSTAEFYARKTTASTNHVDGVDIAGAIPDTSALVLSFDPVDKKSGGGNAFDEAGTYLCYVLLTMSDGDESRYPGKGFMSVNVEANYE